MTRRQRSKQTEVARPDSQYANGPQKRVPKKPPTMRPPRFLAVALSCVGLLLMTYAISLVFLPAGLFFAGAVLFAVGAIPDWGRNRG